ncbi:hypothetical protein DFP73DRAFT_340476 [Morchella snyderi]|nr:hypothetical protein DFP73DRAFT_340476 [Morchella snyderi]
MATVDPPVPLGPSADRGSTRGGRGGRGRVAYFNMGRRGAAPPSIPTRPDQEQQEGASPPSEANSQKSDGDRRVRRRNRSRRSRRNGKDSEASPERATPISERGEALGAVETSGSNGIEGNVPQASTSNESNMSSNAAQQGTPPSAPRQMTGAEKVQALMELHREESFPRQQKRSPRSNNAWGGRSSDSPANNQQSSSNTTGGHGSAGRSDEPPTGPRQASGKRKGKERENRAENHPRGEGSSQRQSFLPQGSHILGETPGGSPPNQRHRQQPQRRFGANLTTEGSEPTPSRSGTPEAGRPKDARMVPLARTFGGKLTEDTAAGHNESGKLRAEATEFEPGKPAEVIPPHLRASGSTAPKANNKRSPYNKDRKKQVEELYKPDDSDDIGTRVHKEIAIGAYECMVCYGGLSRKSKIWNCKCCWAVFHLHCITKWAKQGLDQPPPRSSDANDEPPRRKWKCPACNNPGDEVPDMYTCWCEKTVQPEVTNNISPHSCGQTCGKARTSPKNCPHACDLQCHAGPCPPCTAIGPIKKCYCGSENSQRRCVDTNYEEGWSCQKPCDDFMPCGEHTCPKVCHPGTCGACQVESELRCYCGNHMKSIKCCDRKEAVLSFESGDQGVAQWEGYWNCEKICDRPFDCDKHRCKKICHSQNVLPAHCALSPDVVKSCACGKTNINQLLDKPRQSCEDPVPTCRKVCQKELKCGHPCQRTCHDGECGMCMKMVSIICRCGKTSSSSLCHQGEEGESPQCMCICRAALNCGRHECGDKCCSGESKAMERLSSKKKRPLPSSSNDEGIEPEHICTRPCGRLLKCGTHTCPMLCHRGNCGNCLEASFEDLSCNCGRTVTPAPVPCGASPPACKYQCTRAKDCNHPAVSHPCHLDEEGCPKCPYLVEKICLCGKKPVKSTPCWRDAVSCGTECGRKLSCGSHLCRKVCHKGGQCDEPCKQQCGKPKSVCGHACLDACHAPFQCSEDKPCTTKLVLKCACGGLKQEIKCGASKANPGGNKKELKCTDACRSRRMAFALDIDPDRDAAPPYSEDTLFFYNRDKKFSTTVEAKYRAFAEGSSKRVAFQPMKSSQRAFLHSLATDFGLESESQDPEPYRSVVLTRGSSFIAAPRKTIAEFLVSKPSAMPTAMPASLLQQLKKPQKQAFNALLLKGIRVGLLASELEKELEYVLKDSQLRFSLTWSGDEEVLLLPKTSSLGTEQIELELTELSPKLKRLIAQRGTADSAELCTITKDGLVIGRQGNQWSTVASNKGVPPARLVSTGLNTRNVFNMLGTSGGGEPSAAAAGSWLQEKRSGEGLRKKLVLQKKSEKGKEKAKEEEVVDDWETAAAADEEVVG